MSDGIFTGVPGLDSVLSPYLVKGAPVTGMPDQLSSEYGGNRGDFAFASSVRHAASAATTCRAK